MSHAKYQIFVSSTYEDLKDERDQVIMAILEMGHIPVGMEMFSAADEEQWRIIQRHIDESDYYVAIIAHRYGSVTEDGRSYTRKEYEYAVDTGVPVLGFVIDDSASWPADRFEKDHEAKELLDDFKELAKKKPIGTWSTAEELHYRVSIALAKAFTANPRPGWVQATSTVGPEVMSELSRLSSENARLRDELESAVEQSHVELDRQSRELLRKMDEIARPFSWRPAKNVSWTESDEQSYRWLFGKLAPMLISEASVIDLSSRLAMYLQPDNEESWDTVAINQMQAFLADLMALGLVEPSTKKHSVKDKDEYWTLTEFGRHLLQFRRSEMLLVEGVRSTIDAGDDPRSAEESAPQGS